MSLSTKVSLDCPVWTALATRQAHLGRGSPLARRYDPDVAPFGALAAETPDAYEALRRLLGPHEYVALLSVAPLAGVDGLQAKALGTIQQMVAARQTGKTDPQNVIRLGPHDVPEMLDLAQRTKPGPFGKRTCEMGHYIGIRDGGRLIAMAGERIALTGMSKSAPSAWTNSGAGTASPAELVKVLREEIEERGDTPFLHVFSHNATAIGLYERLGFVLRREFVLTQISPVAATTEDR